MVQKELENFLNDLGKGFLNGMMGGGWKWNHIEKDFW
jgi:hypothetical protein